MDTEKEITPDQKAGLAILIGLLSLLWQYHTWNKLLPLNQANVVFSESDVKIESIKGEEEEMDRDEIRPVFRNIGKAAAEDVKLRIYGMTFENDISISWAEPKPVEKFFDFKLVNSLEPEASASFGVFGILHKVKNQAGGQRDLSSEEQQVALIFHLEYVESITGKPTDKCFAYQYVVGTRQVRSLIDADYSKIKERLTNELDEEPNHDLRQCLGL